MIKPILFKSAAKSFDKKTTGITGSLLIQKGEKPKFENVKILPPKPLVVFKAAKINGIKYNQDYPEYLSDYQKTLFDFVRCPNAGNAIVQSSAGSGKSFCINYCFDLIPASESVCALAFNRAIADKLQIKAAQKDNVNANTTHSFGRQAFVRHFGNPTLSPQKLRWLFEDFLETKENKLGKWSILNLVGYAKNMGIGIVCSIDDRSKWTEIAEHFSVKIILREKSKTKSIDVISWAIELLKLSVADTKRIDYSDMLFAPLYYNLKLPFFDWILVDEAQDQNLTKLIFINRMCHEKTRCFFFGSDYQRIYGFLGCDSKCLEKTKKMFNCKDLPLTTSYRCAVSICDFARQNGMLDIEAAPNAKLGKVHEGLSYKEIMDDPINFFDPKGFVLCRNNAPIIRMALHLVKENIPVNLISEDLHAKFVAEIKGLKSTDILELKREARQKRKDIIEAYLDLGQKKEASNQEDMWDSILAFIDRGIELNLDKKALCKFIKEFFAVKHKWGEQREILTLMTIHKSKGLEAEKIYFLFPELIPSRYAVKNWEVEEEQNLFCVAATRAKTDLYLINK